jgi:hypothetical protein
MAAFIEATPALERIPARRIGNQVTAPSSSGVGEIRENRREKIDRLVGRSVR